MVKRTIAILGLLLGICTSWNDVRAQHFSVNDLLEIYDDPAPFFGEFKSRVFGADTTYAIQLDTAGGQKVLTYSFKLEDMCAFEVESTKLGFRRSIRNWPSQGRDQATYYRWGKYVAILYEKYYQSEPMYFVTLTFDPSPGATPPILYR